MSDLIPSVVAPDQARIETFRFSPNNCIPNNPRLPVMLIRGALGGRQPDEDIHALYRSNDWRGGWAWSVYGFHHYHSTAHEALTVAAGEARLMLGGPEGREVAVAAGDLVVLPAGTGHRRLSCSDDFLVCGAYPAGQEGCDLLRATKENYQGAEARIAAVALPRTDPLYGLDGPVIRLWQGV